jgi:GntR family transcriptional regulator/MocR family aminotransferase
MTGKQANLAWETLLDLSATRPGPLHMRLAAAIRTAIRSGRLPVGAALPPSRMLAADLSVSRWTVTEAYGQLITEGYLTGKTGSATRVTWSPGPGDEPRADPARPRPAQAVRPSPAAGFDLSSCTPDLRSFPRRQWVEAIRAAAEIAPFDRLSYSEPGGLPELRAVLAEHLNRSRGAAAEPGTICIVMGAGQGMSRLCRALVADRHTAIGMESPGSPRLFQAAQEAGLELVPLPVDDDGLVVGALDGQPGLRAVCVGAARQVALGVPLAPHRRPALVDWARRVDGLVIEDDYLSEFSYDHPAPPVLQGTARDRVALLGSMSQALGPTVSIGWVVTPRRWVQAVRAEHEIQLLPPALNQLALVQLMQSGAYDRHLRASRQRYRTRRNVLLDALRRNLPEYRVRGAEGGMQLLLELPSGTDVPAILRAAARRGIELWNLYEMQLQPEPSDPGLLIGYGNLKDSAIDEAVTVLAEIIRGGADPMSSTGVARRTDMTEPKTHTLDVPGAVISYDVRADDASTKPVLLIIGSPMGAAGFVTLAGHFTDRTVVTYDPRGAGRSLRTDDALETTPDEHADDLHRLISALDAGPVDIFASSGGAVNALALVTKHPEQVRTLVAHEPPAMRELPDAETAMAVCVDMHETYLRSGFGPAMAKFIALVSYQGPLPADYLDQPAPDPAAFGLPTEDDGSRNDPLVGLNMIPLAHYQPDYDALRVAATRVILAVGEESGQMVASRAGVAVAERLGTAPVTFPGGHDGFLGGEYGGMGKPDAFAATLRTVLDG